MRLLRPQALVQVRRGGGDVPLGSGVGCRLLRAARLPGRLAGSLPTHAARCAQPHQPPTTPPPAGGGAAALVHHGGLPHGPGRRQEQRPARGGRGAAPLPGRAAPAAGAARAQAAGAAAAPRARWRRLLAAHCCCPACSGCSSGGRAGRPGCLPLPHPCPTPCTRPAPQVTDSQAMDVVHTWTLDEQGAELLPITTFSIAMAHRQSGGRLGELVQGLRALRGLAPGDTVLVSEVRAPWQPRGCALTARPTARPAARPLPGCFCRSLGAASAAAAPPGRLACRCMWPLTALAPCPGAPAGVQPQPHHRQLQRHRRGADPAPAAQAQLPAGGPGGLGGLAARSRSPSRSTLTHTPTRAHTRTRAPPPWQPGRRCRWSMPLGASTPSRRAAAWGATRPPSTAAAA